MARRYGERLERLTAVAVDEYSLWLDTLVRIAESAGLEVVGASTRSREGIQLLESERPDIFMLGLDRNGVDRARVDSLLLAAAKVRPLSTIVLSNDDDPDFIGHCLAEGAVAYVLKTIRPEDLSAALRQAVDRCVYLFGTPTMRGHPTNDQDDLRKLTQREFEVLMLVADGLPNVEIARSLWISVATVKFHLSKMYEKLGVSNRTGAVRWAHQHGLLGESSSIQAGVRRTTPRRRPGPTAQSVSRS